MHNFARKIGKIGENEQIIDISALSGFRAPQKKIGSIIAVSNIDPKIATPPELRNTTSTELLGLFTLSSDIWRMGLAFKELGLEDFGNLISKEKPDERPTIEQIIKGINAAIKHIENPPKKNVDDTPPSTSKTSPPLEQKSLDFSQYLIKPMNEYEPENIPNENIIYFSTQGEFKVFEKGHMAPTYEGETSFRTHNESFLKNQLNLPLVSDTIKSMILDIIYPEPLGEHRQPNQQEEIQIDDEHRAEFIVPGFSRKVSHHEPSLSSIISPLMSPNMQDYRDDIFDMVLKNYESFSVSLDLKDKLLKVRHLQDSINSISKKDEIPPDWLVDLSKLKYELEHSPEYSRKYWEQAKIIVNNLYTFESDKAQNLLALIELDKLIHKYNELILESDKTKKGFIEEIKKLRTGMDNYLDFLVLESKDEKLTELKASLKQTDPYIEKSMQNIDNNKAIPSSLPYRALRSIGDALESFANFVMSGIRYLAGSAPREPTTPKSK